MKPILPFLVIVLAIMASCTEDVIVDLEEGTPLIGVEGSFTDQLKRHQVKLTYSSSFYDNSIEMVTGAHVVVTDSIDTIAYHEVPDRPGYYLTDSVAGKPNTRYRLLIDVPDVSQLGGYQHLYAESFMRYNVDSIDSIAMKPFQVMEDIHPGVSYSIYPYFQSLFDPSLVYLGIVYRNGRQVQTDVSELLTIPMGGYAGYYINGDEMTENNMEIPAGVIRSYMLREGDVIRLDLLSIPFDYMGYLYSLRSSLGSNPLMGSPSNLATNVYPKEKGCGYFYAAAVVSASLVYHKSDYE